MVLPLTSKGRLVRFYSAGLLLLPRTWQSFRNLSYSGPFGWLRRIEKEGERERETEDEREKREGIRKSKKTWGHAKQPCPMVVVSWHREIVGPRRATDRPPTAVSQTDMEAAHILPRVIM